MFISQAQRPREEELLTRQETEGIAMTGLERNNDRGEYRDDAQDRGAWGSHDAQETEFQRQAEPLPVYKVYKRRWFGLIQLVLLNIIVSWDWLSYSPVANTAATFFTTTPTIINWLSTSFLFAFVFASPFTLYALHHSGPRLAIITASILILFGNWIRYAGTRASPPSFAAVMFGQTLIGLAQPFVLTAPTRYSDLWFSPRGRVSATAIASLANPLGGALGQIIDPILAPSPSDIPNMTLYVAIISSIATIPSFFIPARPPSPVSTSSAYHHHRPTSLPTQLLSLSHTPTFWLILLPFATYVGFFNSLSSLLTQILTPYHYSETESGIAGGLLILAGLVAAAITSPLIDRSKRYLLLIQALVPVIALCYLVFIWAPPSQSLVAPYLVCAVLGAASFSLVPVALEWLVEVSWPVGAEVGSVVLWTGGQLLGGVFIIVSNALMDGGEGSPPYGMRRGLVFQAVLAVLVAPSVGVLGWVHRGGVKNRRLEVDRGIG